jgi:dTDP-4-amino-4,6-dideoxygalactose transaminase
MQVERVVPVRKQVPFLDLELSHAELKRTVLAEFADVIDAGAFVNGPQVAAFEQAFATYCGVRFCVGLSSGLDALRLALLGAGIEPGDEVVVPAMTFVATLEAVTQASGRPVLADISEADYCIDPGSVDAAAGPRARFLVPVHLYGQMADTHSLFVIAQARALLVIEDACQAHGAMREGARAGASGLAAAFSFYPTKNLGAFGDAGALVTSDEDLAGRVRALREHGQREKYRHEVEGYTARLDTIQAVVLRHKLAQLDDWNAQRRAAAALYGATLGGVGDLRLPRVMSDAEPVWHLYVVRTADPAGLADFLRQRGIHTGRHYPEPVHLTTAYERLGYRRGAFPRAEALAREALSLPIFPGITEDQIAYVAEAIEDYFRRG